MNARPGNYTIDLTFVVSEAVIDLSKLTANLTAKDKYTLTGTAPANIGVTITDGAAVTLKDATIELPDDCNYADITCSGDAVITLEGTNTVKGGNAAYLGILIVSDDEHPASTLTIKGTGSLAASTNPSNQTGASGIGGGDKASCGDITITASVTSVTTAKGTSAPNSIGAGDKGSCGTVTIGGAEGAITESPYTYKPNP